MQVSDSPRSEFKELIETARCRPSVRGSLLEQYRAQLRVVAQKDLDSAVRPRVDASDIVQNTMIAAERDFHAFRGGTVEEFGGWLMQIHRHRMVNEVKHQRAKKRDVHLDRRIGATMDSSSAGWPEPPASISSPSMREIEQENARVLAQALDKLPENQREAVRLRYIEGWSLADIAQRLDNTLPATAGLLKRGLQNLRRTLRPLEGHI